MSFDRLAARVAEVREKVRAAVARGGHGQRVTIVAVTKTHGPEAVTAAWEAGLRDIGENKVQEALAKMADVAVPVSWHLVGHLQRNKVKSLDRFAVLHSLDSARLADAVCEQGLARGRAGRPGLRVGTRSPFVATAKRDQGLVGTPGPGGPLLLAHNDPRSVSRNSCWSDAYLGGSVHV